MKSTLVRPLWQREVAATAIVVMVACVAQDARAYPFVTTEINNYLLIGMGPDNAVGKRPGIGDAVDTSNFELGAIKAPVPSTSGFASSPSKSGFGTSGPGIRGNAPNIPLAAKPVATGVFNDGNIAITHTDGSFHLSNIGLYANSGIRCAQSASGCNDGASNTYWNDPNHYPNTFTPTGTGASKNNNVDGTGVHVNQGAPGTALTNTNGVNGNFNFTSLLAELNTARGVIAGLASTAVLNVTANGGKLTKVADGATISGGLTISDAMINDGRNGASGDNMNDVGRTIITLKSGLNVIDINAGGSDFLIENSSLVIDGPDDAFAIFRVPDSANMKLSNANLLIGNGGIGLGDVIFFSDRPDNNNHFDWSNGVINGVRLWTMGYKGGGITFDDVQGCTQLIGDKIDLQDVRLNRCAAGTTQVPEPGALSLLALGLLGLGAMRRRKPH